MMLVELVSNTGMQLVLAISLPFAFPHNCGHQLLTSINAKVYLLSILLKAWKGYQSDKYFELQDYRSHQLWD